MTFSSSKTAVVHFTKRRRAPNACPLPALILQNQPVQLQASYKYLGVIFQSNGSWKLHSDQVLNKLRFHQYNLSRVCNSSHRIPPLVLRSFVYAFCITRITYGMPFWWPNKGASQSMDSIVSTLLASSLRLNGHPHHLSVRFEFNIPTTHLLFDLEVQRFFVRLSGVSLSHPSTVLLYAIDATRHPNSEDERDAFPDLVGRAFNVNLGWLSAFQLAPTELAKDVRNEVIREWEEDESGAIKKLYNNKKHLPPSTPAYLKEDSPKTACIRARLRFERTTLQSRLHVYNKHESPNCKYCMTHTQKQTIDDSRHVLLFCPQFKAARFVLARALRRHGLSVNLILGCVDHMRRRERNYVLDHTATFLEHIYTLRPKSI